MGRALSEPRCAPDRQHLWGPRHRMLRHQPHALPRRRGLPARPPSPQGDDAVGVPGGDMDAPPVRQQAGRAGGVRQGVGCELGGWAGLQWVGVAHPQDLPPPALSGHGSRRCPSTCPSSTAAGSHPWMCCRRLPGKWRGWRLPQMTRSEQPQRPPPPSAAGHLRPPPVLASSAHLCPLPSPRLPTLALTPRQAPVVLLPHSRLQ